VLPLAAKLALGPVLLAQARYLRSRTPLLPEAAGPREGLTTPNARMAAAHAASAPHAVRVLVVGDSSAAGVGVAHQRQALTGHLTRHLAQLIQRPVAWRVSAKMGDTTQMTLQRVQREHAERPMQADVAVVATGVNDLHDQVPSHHAVAHRADLADWLLAHTGARHVLMVPLPPVHQFPLLPNPLRWVVGADARRHDKALAEWAATRNDVSHPRIDMTLGWHNMAADGFHPGEPVYRMCGEALAEHLARQVLARTPAGR
jgi:lysophospholipase L1-like esterase